MDDEHAYDLAMLRILPEMQQQVEHAPASKSKGREWQRHYTLVPREWELRLLDAKHMGTYRLAIELLYLHWWDKGKPVTLSGKAAKAVKLPARSKSRALAELERLGLVSVARQPRRSPRVTLLHTEAQKSRAGSREGGWASGPASSAAGATSTRRH
jgi:hypothetical protein